MFPKRLLVFSALIVFTGPPVLSEDLGTSFTVQGYLQRAGIPVDDTCSLQLHLFDVFSGGTPLAGPVFLHNVEISQGVFSTSFGFGMGANGINGTARYISVDIKCPSDATYVPLIGRITLRPAPHALALPGVYTLQNPVAVNVIEGHHTNFIEDGVFGAAIGGGGPCPSGSCGTDSSENKIFDHFGTIAGGSQNSAGLDDGFPQDLYPTVGGGRANTSIGFYSTVGGGFLNTANGASTTVAGGRSNLAGQSGSTAGGGQANTASGYMSTVSGGEGNSALGNHATVPGGFGNVAGGFYSFAAGSTAVVRSPATVGDFDGDQGTFVWADTGGTFTSTGPNQFLIRASGGVGIGTNAPDNSLHVRKGSAGTVTGHSNGVLVVENSTDAYVQMLTPTGDERGILFGEAGNSVDGGIIYNAAGTPDGFQFRTDGNFTKVVIEADGTVGILRTTTAHPLHVGTNSTNGNGAHVTAGGTWTNGSDRNSKENVQSVDPATLLEKLAALPVSQWNYKGEEEGVRHIGPMAQDFRAAFGLGHDERYITTIDADGVALAAIQGLHDILQQKDCELGELKEENAKIREQLATLEAMVRQLSTQMQGGEP